MIDKIYIKITDLLPVIGGAGGAAAGHARAGREGPAAGEDARPVPRAATRVRGGA